MADERPDRAVEPDPAGGAAADGPDVSIVIPFQDERENLAPLRDELTAMMSATPTARFEVILVDDGSTDGGAATAEDLCREDARFALLRHGRHRGKSAALLTGFAAARAPVVAVLDADLQNPPAEIPRLLAELERGGWDAVLGVRAKRRDPWRVRAASRIANRARRWVLGDEALDVGCALMCFRRELAENLPRFEGLHRFLPAFWRAGGARITQVGVAHRPRTRGESKYTVRGRAWRGLVDLFGVRWLLARSVGDGERRSGATSYEERDR